MPAPPIPHPDAAPPGSVLPSHYANCFGCGSEHPAGLGLTVQVLEGAAVRGRFRVTDQHQGAPGLIHGGVLAAAFDEVLGALNWLLLAPAVTGRLETDFMVPVSVGVELVIEAVIDEVDGRKVWASAVGFLPDGTVAARARGLFIQVPLAHFARHTSNMSADVPGGGTGLELNP